MPGTAGPPRPAPATLAFRLSVPDGTLADTVTVTGQGNRAPTAGSDQAGRTVTLDGTGSGDQDGNPPAYLWSQISGTSMLLSDRTAASPSFAAETPPGILVFRLGVSDGLAADTDTVTITVQPSVVNATIRLHGSPSLSLAQGLHPDSGATCAAGGSAWRAYAAFTGPLSPAGSGHPDGRPHYNYKAVGQYTITCTCGSAYDLSAARTVTIRDAPPSFDWSLYPESVFCRDVTDGIWTAILSGGTYTCADSNGHTVSATGPP